MDKIAVIQNKNQIDINRNPSVYPHYPQLHYKFNVYKFNEIGLIKSGFKLIINIIHILWIALCTSFLKIEKRLFITEQPFDLLIIAFLL